MGNSSALPDLPQLLCYPQRPCQWPQGFRVGWCLSWAGIGVRKMPERANQVQLVKDLIYAETGRWFHPLIPLLIQSFFSPKKVPHSELNAGGYIFQRKPWRHHSQILKIHLSVVMRPLSFLNVCGLKNERNPSVSVFLRPGTKRKNLNDHRGQKG